MDDAMEGQGPDGIPDQVLRGELVLDYDRQKLSLLGRVARYTAELMLPLTAVTTFDDIFATQGLGLEAGLAITLWYTFWVGRRLLRRGERRGQEFEDPNDEIEEVSDYVGDFISAIVMLVLVTWLAPSAPLYLDAGFTTFAWALWTAAGLVGLTGAASLREGVLRMRAHSRVRRDLETWEPKRLLIGGSPESDLFAEGSSAEDLGPAR